MKEVIHFSHANGFPASIYRTMFAELSDDYDVRFIERIGHDRRYPVTRGWTHLVEELLDDIDRQYEQPVWLVGHSLGGYLSFLAACRRPQRIKGVVMIDSPVVGGWRGNALRVLQWAGLDERFSPAAATRVRRTHWASREEAWQHFHSKPAFARWDERMLSDYIDHGTHQTGPDGARTLAFDRDIEYRIYRALSPSMGARMAHGARVPMSFLAGTRSHELSQVGLGMTKLAVGRNIEWIEGSHLFPMEKPIETARAIQRMLNRLRETRR